MQWTDRIRQVKIVLVIAAFVIAGASLLASHFLVKDLSEEERNKMETWAEALNTHHIHKLRLSYIRLKRCSLMVSETP